MVYNRNSEAEFPRMKFKSMTLDVNFIYSVCVLYNNECMKSLLVFVPSSEGKRSIDDTKVNLHYKIMFNLIHFIMTEKQMSAENKKAYRQTWTKTHRKQLGCEVRSILKLFNRPYYLCIYRRKKVYDPCA